MESKKYEYGTLEYYRERVLELEEERDDYKDRSNYYQQQLVDAHALLGRVIHQTSERWDSVRLTKYYPTDNLHGRRSINNPKGDLSEISRA